VTVSEKLQKLYPGLRGVDRRFGHPCEAWCQFLSPDHPHKKHTTPMFMHCNELSETPLDRPSEFVASIINGTWAEVPPADLARKLNYFAHARNASELIEAKLMAFGESNVPNDKAKENEEYKNLLTETLTLLEGLNNIGLIEHDDLVNRIKCKVKPGTLLT